MSRAPYEVRMLARRLVHGVLDHTSGAVRVQTHVAKAGDRACHGGYLLQGIGAMDSRGVDILSRGDHVAVVIMCGPPSEVLEVPLGRDDSLADAVELVARYLTSARWRS